MYTILIYFVIAWISFMVGFFLCAILTNSKNREYQEVTAWGNRFEGKDVIHDGKNYLIKLNNRGGL